MYLIISADDFGFSEETNQAIRELKLKGIVNSTTVLSNIPYSYQINALADAKWYGISLHLNLSHCKPISMREEVSCIVDKNGDFIEYK